MAPLTSTPTRPAQINEITTRIMTSHARGHTDRGTSRRHSHGQTQVSECTRQPVCVFAFFFPRSVACGVEHASPDVHGRIHDALPHFSHPHLQQVELWYTEDLFQHHRRAAHAATGTHTCEGAKRQPLHKSPPSFHHHATRHPLQRKPAASHAAAHLFVDTNEPE